MCVGVSMCLGWSGIRVADWRTTSCTSACNTPTQPYRNSNTHRTKNNTANEVIQRNSRKLLMMDILMSEICWAHKKWNKIASDIKLIFYSSTITMMHGPINIRLSIWFTITLFLCVSLISPHHCITFESLILKITRGISFDWTPVHMTGNRLSNFIMSLQFI